MKNGVYILDNDSLEHIWPGAEVMSLSVTQIATATKFAVEDGTTRSDHVVQNPIEISLTIMLVDDISQAFEEILDTYERNGLVTIQTRTAVYTDLLVVAIPQAQKSDALDASEVSVKLSQWREVVPEYGALSPKKVAKKKQASTINNGTQATAELPIEKKASILAGLLG